MPPTATETVVAPLGYAPAGAVVDDDERAGLRRAPTVPRTAPEERRITYASCTISNIDTADPAPRFAEAGFEAVRLPDREGLSTALRGARTLTAMTDDLARQLRTLLAGTEIDLADGSRLRIDHVADEGVLLRVAGPDGATVDGAEHHAAASVHIDQDVRGTPLRQLFDDSATEVFGHTSPDSTNRSSQQHLVNLWLPVQQVTRPLTLMDGRTLDRPRHQLRYRLPVESFLDRDEDQTVNDIWQCLHDPDQEWWFRPEMTVGDAYVFDTLSTAHASFVISGEAAAAERYECLGAVLAALNDGDVAQAREAASAPMTDPAAVATEPLRAAVATMDAVLADVRALEPDAESHVDGSLVERAEAARNAVVRRSIELRAVATRRPADS